MSVSRISAILLAGVLLAAWAGAPASAQTADDLFDFATYFGGSNFDGINGVTTDAGGNLIIVGSTISTDFPLLNAAQSTLGGSFDAFIAKIDPVQGELLFSTYLGGSGTDFFEDVVVGEDGVIYVVGTTQSSDFPGAAAKTGQASRDAIVVTFTADGQVLFTSRIGGSDLEEGHGIALFDYDNDGDLDIYLTGTTASDDFPLVDPVQNAPGGGTDAFVTIVNGDTGAILFSTYLGGSGDDTSNAIDVGDINDDGFGDVVLTGGTNSDDFATRGRSDARGKDPYLATLFTNRTFRFLDQPQVDLFPIDEANAAMLDRDDEAWDVVLRGPGFIAPVGIAGQTNSTAFPTTPDALQQNPGGSQDAFFVVIDPETGEIGYSTLIGGAGNEIIRGIDFDINFVYLNGETSSFVPLPGFPTVGSGQLFQLNLTPDDFEFVRLARAGSTPNVLVQGGSGPCLGAWSSFGLEIDAPITFQPQENGGGDGFLACFTRPEGVTLGLKKMANKTMPRVGEVVEYAIEVTNTGGIEAKGVVVSDLVRFKELHLLDADLPFTTRIGGDGGVQIIEFEAFDLPPGATRVVRVGFVVLSLGEMLVFPDVRNIAQADNEQISTPFLAQAMVHPQPREGALQVIAPVLSGGKRSQDAFDVYVDSVRVADDVTTATAFLPVTLNRTTPRIDLVAADAPANDDPLASFEVDLLFPHPDSILAFSETSVLVLAGLDSGTPRSFLKHAARTEADDPSQVEFFVAHAAGGIGPVDVRLLDDTPAHTVLGTVADDLPADTTSDYAAVPPGGYNLEVTTADGAALLGVFHIDWNAAAGRAFSVILGAESGTLGVVAVDAVGTVIAADVVTASGVAEQPVRSAVLHAAYPNPFRGTTHINYDLPQPAPVRLAIYDVLGREVAVLIDDAQPAGRHEAVWNGRDGAGVAVASGVYYCRFESGETLRQRTLLLVR